MMSKEKISKKKIEKTIRKHMLTAYEAGHMSLFCPELPRRSQLLMSTVGLSQNLFSYISTNSSTILMVSMAMESP